MSKINEIACKIMNKYSIDRQPQHWDNPEPPPKEPYSQNEVYAIIDSITKEINSYLADLLINKYPID